MALKCNAANPRQSWPHMQARGRRLRFVAVLLVCSSTLAMATAAQAQGRLDDQFDDDTKPWQEIAVQFPAVPADADLLPFDVSATATQRFAIDAKSLTVGADAVIRYTLVTQSAAGARNVSYEAIRCASLEYKIYALGHPDGTWSRARRDQWQPIVNNAMNRQQAALVQDYFCLANSPASSVAEMLRRLRRQETLTKELTR